MVTAPTAHPSISTVKQQGDRAYSARDFAAAVEHYSEALEAVEDPVVLSNRSATHALRRRFDKALNDSERALVLQPSWPRLHHRKGHALFHLGRYAEAIRAFELGIGLDPGDSSLRCALDKAREYTEIVAPRPAVSAASAAVAATGRAPRKAGAFSRAADAAKPAASAPEARRSLAAVDSCDAPSGDVLREEGNAFFRTGQHAAAVAKYSEAILQDAQDERTWANRAAARTALLRPMCESGEVTEPLKHPHFIDSLGDIEESLRLDPRYVKAWARKGQLYFIAEEISLAKEAYDAGLGVDGASPECVAGRDMCVARSKS